MNEQKPMITVLTKSTFLPFVKSEGISAVFFESESCPACRSFARTFATASIDQADTRFARVDVQSEQELAQKLEISHLPTLLIVREGVLVFRQPGDFSAVELGAILQQARSVDLAELRARVDESQKGSEAA